MTRDATAPSGPGPGPGPASRQPGIRRRGALIDIDVHRMDVRKLLRHIATATGTNLILFDDVQGTVTVQLRGQPVHTALEVVARAVGCFPKTSGRMVLVRCAR